MSTTTATSDLSSKQRRILEYLRDRADSETYFKSRVIGEDLGLSAKEVGANMRAISDGEYGLDVSKWGYSSGTTWQISA
jgi:DNA-binding Lrp family transcriptional regulator